MSIAFTTDSSCDLSDDLLQHFRIQKFPLTIIQGGEPYLDGHEITPEDIYRHVAEGGVLPTTSAVNLVDYQSRFAALSKTHDAVIHVSIGASFSSCHFNARLAAAEFSNVFVIDSKNLSGGQAQVLLEGCLLAESGLPATKIAAHLVTFADRVAFSFALDQVAYLHKGGRCSGIAALSANLLHLRPAIDLKNGKLSVGKKYRGAFEKALHSYIRDQLSDRTDIDPKRILFVHTGCSDELVALVRQDILTYSGYEPYATFTAGCTIASH
ncbi:MAG: DegV family protein, partial [Evtepia sp.]